ncbi:nuclear transport factor 2 (NTF2) superfamily protein [Actinokineospora baliensis]|uniref:nuclear transport factor 2 family protein n=1 Tax=Actinokineospora baliensis TaxID=547056 RepID=UPI0027DCB545|nr:nuclear transport factor 2 family protein [Actinokineospora baliensis]MBM7773119.1 nuclear transport factor 2 (NTF2) superfamily protein [Actinokineospora baliensis]
MPLVPPFTAETAAQKVQAAEDLWNTRDPERVARAYTPDSLWRNRDRLLTGHAEIVAFLQEKWDTERDYALRKELWGFRGNRIGVRFQYECQDITGQWWRSYGNELWEFAPDGRNRRREASINDLPIDERDRRITGPRPTAEHGLLLPVL